MAQVPISGVRETHRLLPTFAICDVFGLRPLLLFRDLNLQPLGQHSDQKLQKGKMLGQPKFFRSKSLINIDKYFSFAKLNV